jgi:hypothetical protein
MGWGMIKLEILKMVARLRLSEAREGEAEL